MACEQSVWILLSVRFGRCNVVSHALGFVWAIGRTTEFLPELAQSDKPVDRVIGYAFEHLFEQNEPPLAKLHRGITAVQARERLEHVSDLLACKPSQIDCHQLDDHSLFSSISRSFEAFLSIGSNLTGRYQRREFRPTAGPRRESPQAFPANKNARPVHVKCCLNLCESTHGTIMIHSTDAATAGRLLVAKVHSRRASSVNHIRQPANGDRMYCTSN